MPGWTLLLPPVELNKTLRAISKLKVKTSGGDFRDIFNKVKDNSLGLVLTDMPWDYESPQVNWVLRNKTSKYQLSLPYPTLTAKDTKDLLILVSKKLKNHRNCWLWSDWRHVPILINIGKDCGLKYFALCVALRKGLGLGNNVRKQLYYVVGLSKGSPEARGHLSEFLGEFTFKGSHKPWEANILLLRHSLPPGEKWLDPFPATHTELPSRLHKLQSAELSSVYKVKKLRKSDTRKTI